MASISESYIDLYEKYREQINSLASFSSEWEVDKSNHCAEYETLTLEEKALVDNDMEYLKEAGVFSTRLDGIIEEDAEVVLSRLVKRNREQCGNN